MSPPSPASPSAEDPIPNFHALQEAAGGDLSSSAYAGLGNVEMELFTGVPSAFPGASESLTTLSDRTTYSRLPSLVKALEGQGYETAMVHSYNDSLYNRASNLPAIGFDQLVYDEDFTVESGMKAATSQITPGRPAPYPFGERGRPPLPLRPDHGEPPALL